MRIPVAVLIGLIMYEATVPDTRPAESEETWAVKLLNSSEWRIREAPRRGCKIKKETMEVKPPKESTLLTVTDKMYDYQVRIPKAWARVHVVTHDTYVGVTIVEKPKAYLGTGVNIMIWAEHGRLGRLTYGEIVRMLAILGEKDNDKLYDDVGALLEPRTGEEHFRMLLSQSRDSLRQAGADKVKTTIAFIFLDLRVIYYIMDDEIRLVTLGENRAYIRDYDDLRRAAYVFAADGSYLADVAYLKTQEKIALGVASTIRRKRR